MFHCTTALLLIAAATLLSACNSSTTTLTPASAPNVAAPAPAAATEPAFPPADITPARLQLDDTEVRTIESTILGRRYEIFVSLPRSYRDNADRRYPVLFITDTTYAFPLVRSIARMVGDHGNGLEDFILVGLGYAVGETGQQSRRRDYTPTRNGPRSATTSDMPGQSVVHGEGAAYLRFIRDEVFPLIASDYRSDMGRKVFAGHSYGGLLGAQMLLTEPTMFQKTILSSPSLWFDKRIMFQRERDYAKTHDDLPAEVFLSIGSFETLKPGSSNPRYNTEADMVADTRRFEAQLRAHHYPNLRIQPTVVLTDEDHLTVYPAAITRGLLWAFPPKR